jgi:hypothetical protein
VRGERDGGNQGEDTTGRGDDDGRDGSGAGASNGHRCDAEDQEVDAHGPEERGRFDLGHHRYVTGPVQVIMPRMNEDHREVAETPCLVVEPPDPPVERWRPVAGYEGLYEVSDAGRVRGLTRTIRGRIKGTWRRWQGRILTPERCRSGTLAVQLCRDGTIRKRAVHDLVLEAFATPVPMPRRRGRHHNDDRADNRLPNLEWGPRLHLPRGLPGEKRVS